MLQPLNYILPLLLISACAGAPRLEGVSEQGGEHLNAPNRTGDNMPSVKHSNLPTIIVEWVDLMGYFLVNQGVASEYTIDKKNRRFMVNGTDILFDAIAISEIKDAACSDLSNKDPGHEVWELIVLLPDGKEGGRCAF